jgi:hypothetical protein
VVHIVVGGTVVFVVGVVGGTVVFVVGVVGGTVVFVVGVVGGTVVFVVGVVGGTVVFVVVTGLPCSVTTVLPDVLTLPFTVASENVNRLALTDVFADTFATRLNLAAHFTLASNPLTFGLDDQAHVFAFLTVARSVTDPPDALRPDLLAVTVTSFGPLTAVFAKATNGTAESEPKATAATTTAMRALTSTL